MRTALFYIIRADISRFRSALAACYPASYVHVDISHESLPARVLSVRVPCAVYTYCFVVSSIVSYIAALSSKCWLVLILNLSSSGYNGCDVVYPTRVVWVRTQHRTCAFRRSVEWLIGWSLGSVADGLRRRTCWRTTRRTTRSCSLRCTISRRAARTSLVSRKVTHTPPTLHDHTHDPALSSLTNIILYNLIQPSFSSTNNTSHHHTYHNITSFI